jgi:predicted nuclease of predicted toxin-antitoxin system
LSGKNHKKYQHEELVLFMDDCFCDAESTATLRNAGFRVEEINTHFPQNLDLIGKRAQSVKDPEVIKLCHKNGWLIVSKDKNMRITHVEVIKKHPNTMILATSHNPCCEVEVWIASLIKTEIDLKRKFKKQQRPWYAQFNRQGVITVCETIENQTTRRVRAKEI